MALKIFVSFILVLSLGAFAATSNDNNIVVSKLHQNPPSPCISKSEGDTSSGMKSFPQGETNEQLRNVMGMFVSPALERGVDLLSSKDVVAVYTAVFYQDASINEVGIYAYQLRNAASPDSFVAVEGFNGNVRVLGNHLLVVLWHEKLEKTRECFEAMNKALEAYGEPQSGDSPNKSLETDA